MVRIAGLEPEYSVFTVSLIVAIARDWLPRTIRRMPFRCNDIIAYASSVGLNFLCGVVR